MEWSVDLSGGQIYLNTVVQHKRSIGLHLIIYTIVKVQCNAPVICNHSPHPHLQGRVRVDSLKCGAITFLIVPAVQGKCQGFDAQILTQGRLSIERFRAKSLVLHVRIQKFS